MKKVIVLLAIAAACISGAVVYAQGDLWSPNKMPIQPTVQVAKMSADMRFRMGYDIDPAPPTDEASGYAEAPQLRMEFDKDPILKLQSRTMRKAYIAQADEKARRRKLTEFASPKMMEDLVYRGSDKTSRSGRILLDI